MALLLLRRLAGRRAALQVTRGRRRERRVDEYAFPTVGSLYDHFEGRLPREAMVSAVRTAISEFVPRDGSGLEAMRLQLLNKCERTLQNMVRTQAGTRPVPQA